MIERLAPSMAKTILGDKYSPDFRYELETSEEGLQVIITNKETGESSVLKLSEDATESTHYDPIYNAEVIKARGEYNKRGRFGFILAFAICGVCILAACLTVYNMSNL